jgi:hypothetical protein
LQAISVLEKATYNSPSTAVIAEPFLFNLGLLAFLDSSIRLLSDFSGVSDAYELRAHTVMEKKRALLIEVAKWSGDGLRPTALKLP